MPKGIYFQNFIDAFEKAKMGEYFMNSVLVTVLALAILLVVALPAAYVLVRCRFFGSKVINILFMGGLFINVNYIVVPIFLIYEIHYHITVPAGLYRQHCIDHDRSAQCRTAGLLTMLVGLAGILVLLYLYNKKYQ